MTFLINQNFVFTCIIIYIFTAHRHCSHTLYSSLYYLYMFLFFDVSFSLYFICKNYFSAFSEVTAVKFIGVCKLCLYSKNIKSYRWNPLNDRTTRVKIVNDVSVHNSFIFFARNVSSLSKLV